MTIYLTLLIMTLLGVMFFDARPQRFGALRRRGCGSCAGTIFYWLTGLIFFIVAGLRFRLGVDTIIFEIKLAPDELLPQNLNFREPGVLMLRRLTYIFGNSILFYQLVIAFWINLSVFAFGWRYRERLGYRLFLFIALYLVLAYMPLNFETARQGAAIGFLLWAWPLFEKRKWIGFTLLTACGALFHYASLIMILLPLCTISPLKYLYSSRRNILITAVCCIIAGYLLNWFLFVWLPPKNLLGVALSEKLDNHAGYTALMKALNWKGIAGYLIRTALYPAMALLLMRRRDTGALTGIYFALSGLGSHFIGRFYWPFCFFCFAATVEAVAMYRNRLPLWLWLLVFAPLAALTIRQYTGQQTWRDGSRHRTYELYGPYNTWFNPQRDTVRENAAFDLYPFHEEELGKKALDSMTPPNAGTVTRRPTQTETDRND